MSFGPGRAVLVAIPPGGPESIAIVLGALARGATVLVTAELDRLAAGLREKPPDGAVVSASFLRQLHAEWEEETKTPLAAFPVAHPDGLCRRAPIRHAIRDGTRLAEVLVLSRIRGRFCGGLRGWGVLGAPAGQDISDFFAATGGPDLRYAGVVMAPVAR